MAEMDVVLNGTFNIQRYADKVIRQGRALHPRWRADISAGQRLSESASNSPDFPISNAVRTLP